MRRVVAKEKTEMADIGYLGIVAAFFWLTGLLVRLGERL